MPASDAAPDELLDALLTCVHAERAALIAGRADQLLDLSCQKERLAFELQRQVSQLSSADRAKLADHLTRLARDNQLNAKLLAIRTRAVERSLDALYPSSQLQYQASGMTQRGPRTLLSISV